MDENSVRLLIRVLSRAAACGTVIAAEQRVMDSTTKKAKGVNPIQFHVLCFELWNDEKA